MTHPHPLDRLTARQREIVLLRLDGLSASEVAARAYLSVRAVSWTCDQARDRLGLPPSHGTFAWLLPLAREVGRFEGRNGGTE